MDAIHTHIPFGRFPRAVFLARYVVLMTEGKELGNVSGRKMFFVAWTFNVKLKNEWG